MPRTVARIATLAAAALLFATCHAEEGQPGLLSIEPQELHALRDPFQRTALRALRGDFGALTPWQKLAYRLGLRLGVTANRLVAVTQYNGNEPDGRVDRYGRPCTMRTAACNVVRSGDYIWTRFGIRQVLDCGARRNDVVARRVFGAAHWVDYWYRSARDARRAGLTGWHLSPCAVIPVRATKGVER